MSQVARKHNPEILRFKRIARAIGIPWREVCQERDRLTRLEREQRQSEDEARKTAWIAHNRLNGWATSHDSFWRNGLYRAYRRRIERGADYTSIPHYDEIAASVREQLPEYREAETAEIFELLLGEYVGLRPVTVHYSNALAGLAMAELATADAPF